MSVVVFHHTGRYPGEDFTIDEVIASLAAQRELIEAGLRFLADADPDFKYDASTIRVQSLVASTLAWDLVIEVYGKYQKSIEERVVGGLEEMFEYDIPPEIEPIVTLAFLAVTYMVARYAYERFISSQGRGGGAPSIHLSGEGNVVIQQIAERIGSAPFEVEKALERSLPPKERKRLVGRVADFFRPARKDGSSKIEFKDAPDISKEAVMELPSDANLELVDDSSNIDVEGARLDIRGTDRDKLKQGWHGQIVGDPRFPKRMPMSLYPTVDPNALADHRSVSANLIVECDRDAAQNLRPKRIHLLSFEPEKSAE